MSRILVFVVVVGVISFTATVTWFIFTDESEDDGPLAIELQPDDERIVAQGAGLYAQYCASCHGSNLEGQPNWRGRNAQGRLLAPPHDETGHTWHHPDMALFQLTKFGPAALVGQRYESDMPGYEGVLTDQEILAVLSFIKSQWPDEIQEQHDEINARGSHH